MDDISGKARTYVIDPESAAEMARLMQQDRLVTQSLGGIFLAPVDVDRVDDVLDVGCGPGGWALQVAHTHRDINVVGIDISQKMITYASTQAQVQCLDNAHFYVMDATQPLHFPSRRFDLINMRLGSTFMTPSVWPSFLQECRRLLRTGGILCITDMEWGFSNKAAFERYIALFHTALQKAGQSFSPNGLHLGLLPVLRHLLQDASLEQVEQTANVIDLSSGTEAHEGYFRDLFSAFHLLEPFIMKWCSAEREEIDHICEQALLEMQQDDFCSIAFFLTVWGFKRGNHQSNRSIKKLRL